MREKIVKYQKTILLSWGAILTVLTIVLGLIYFSNQDVVAQVNGEKITKDEFYTLLNEQYGDDLLEAIISEILVKQEAKEKNISATAAEIDEEIEILKESYGGEDTFNEAMNANGITTTRIKKDLETYILTRKILESRFEVTDEELESYFEENKNSFDANAIYEDHKDEIKEILMNEKMQTEYSVWLDEEMEKAEIKKF